MERFHGTFRSDFLDQVGPFTSVEEAQAAVDAWVADYNTQRPHQGLDEKLPVTPADRFKPEADQDRGQLDVWLPPTLVRTPKVTTATATATATVDDGDEAESVSGVLAVPAAWTGGPVELSTGWCHPVGT